MKNLLRFLIPVLFVAALFDAAGWCGFSSKDDSAESIKIEKLTYSDTVSTPDLSSTGLKNVVVTYKADESLTEELNDIEPFIEDYYPKIDLKRFESFDNNENKVTLEEVEKDQGENIEEKVEINSEEIIYNKEEKDEDTSKSINKKSNQVSNVTKVMT